MKKTGDEWELIAIRYLQSKGYQIITTNFKFGRVSEIDIIAKLDGVTIFVEVKYRKTAKFWTPEESMTSRKCFLFQKAILNYCSIKRLDMEKIRVDLIAISDGKLRHYRNFEL